MVCELMRAIGLICAKGKVMLMWMGWWMVRGKSAVPVMWICG